MRKLFIPIITAALLIGVSSCGDQKKDTHTTKKDHVTKVDTKKVISNGFSYNNDSTKVSWEAYKTTAKKGVKGHFTEFEIIGTKDGTSPQEVFKNASFVIQTSSVNTGLELRDYRIVNNFFKIFVNTSTITGKVKSISDNTATLEISLNEVTKDIEMAVISNGNEFALNGNIALGLFNGQSAVDSLNYVCKDVHAGADGITKLWPDVAIKVSTVLLAR